MCRIPTRRALTVLSMLRLVAVRGTLVALVTMILLILLTVLAITAKLPIVSRLHEAAHFDENRHL